MKKSLIDMYVRRFFELIRGSSITPEEASELFRFSMCKVLDLGTADSKAGIVLRGRVVMGLSEVYDVRKLTLEQRQGILEGCVHCMEMSRRALYV